MSKICPECGKPPIEEGLIKCHKCKVAFVDESEMGLKLSKSELELISKNLVNSWRFWIQFSAAFLVALLLVGVPTVTVIGVHIATKRLNSSLDNFNQQASNHLGLAYQDVTNRISTAFQNYELRADTELAAAHQDVTNRIAKEFEEPKIYGIVTEVAATQATSLMNKQISPQIENFRAGTSNTLAQFDSSLAVFQKQSTNALADVRSATEFSLVVAKASCDDRASFIRLLEIASDKNSSVSQSADSVATFIMESVYANTLLWENQLYFKWELFGINPSTNSLQQLESFYFAHPKEAPTRFFVIKQIFNDDRFSEADRYDFLGKVLEQDNSLVVVNEACNLIDKKAGLHLTVGSAPNYYQWIQEHRSSFTNALVVK